MTEFNLNDIPKNVTNRELALMIYHNLEKNEMQHKAILAKVESYNTKSEETLKKILEQTTKTNGSVKGLLLWRANIRGKTFLIPGIISATIAAVIAWVVNYFTK